MSLEDAVDLVIYAFKNAKNGDLFVQKAPAATLEVLSNSLLQLYKSNSKIKIQDSNSRTISLFSFHSFAAILTKVTSLGKVIALLQR